MKWLTTCKETTVLASRAMDARLSFGDRLALRLHLAICENCTRFVRQLKEMRQLLRSEAAAESTPGLTDAARARIGTELQKELDSRAS
jgi:anti-sigma factor RsiW